MEIKYIVGYLSYGLKGLIIYPNADNEICTLSIKNGSNNECDINDFINGTYPIKPILRPLSGLTKEIEVNGEKFVPLKYIQEKIFMCDISEFEITKSLDFEVNCEEQFYVSFYDVKNMIEFLYKHNFDIHGLIEKGEAIDINTLSNGKL